MKCCIFPSGQPVLVEVSISLRNILEIDEHKQVRLVGVSDCSARRQTTEHSKRCSFGVACRSKDIFGDKVGTLQFLPDSYEEMGGCKKAAIISTSFATKSF